jgi:hypothetical protein
VVHRVDRDTPFTEPSLRSIGRLFWLILKAAGYDPGPDASLAAATGERLKGENLIAKFQDRTISFGVKRKDGPLTMRFGLDGRISYLRWDEAFGPSTGTWTIVEDQLCIINIRRRCYIAVSDGDHIRLFDPLGVMQIDAVAVSH